MDWITLLSQHPGVMIALIFIIGLCVGSFLNVVISRTPSMLDRHWRRECQEYLNPNTELAKEEPFNLMTPRSACPKCKQTIKPYFNIPLLGYILLRGKCGSCREKISPVYPIVELLFGFSCAWIALLFLPNYLMTTGAIIFVAFLFCLFFIDLKTQLLPDELTLPLLWIGLIFNIKGTFVPLETALIGAIAGYMSLWLIFWLYKLLTGKEGMGYGDFKLFGAIGAWVGWQFLPFVILFGCILTLAVAIILRITTKRDLNEPFPFGPALAFAGYLAMLKGDLILSLMSRFL